MALLHPFRALRPVPRSAPAVSSVPYDVVSTDEARQLAAGNPLSFLHVTRSEIDLPPDTDPYAPQVYEKARANLDALRERSAARARRRRRRSTSTGCGWATTSRPASPAVSRSTSTSATSSRSTSAPGATRRTIARVTSSSCVRRPAIVFLTYQGRAGGRPRSTRGDRVGPAALRFHAPTTACSTRSGGLGGTDAGHCVADAFGTCRRSTSPTAITAPPAPPAPAPSCARRAGSADADSVHRRRVPRRPDAGAARTTAPSRISPARRPAQFLDALRQRLPVSRGIAGARAQGGGAMYLDGRWYALDLVGLTPEDESRASSPRRRAAAASRARAAAADRRRPHRQADRFRRRRARHARRWRKRSTAARRRWRSRCSRSRSTT